MKPSEALNLKKGDIVRISSDVSKSMRVFGSAGKHEFAGTEQIIRKVEKTREKGPRIFIENPRTLSFCPKDIVDLVKNLEETQVIAEQEDVLFDPVHLDI